jgi:hypothetical protein
MTDKQDFGVVHDKDIFSSAVHNRFWLPAINRKGFVGFVLEGLGGRSLLLYSLFPADVRFRTASCCPPLPYKTNNGVSFSQPKKREALSSSRLGGVTDQHKVSRVMSTCEHNSHNTLIIVF